MTQITHPTQEQPVSETADDATPRPLNLLQVSTFFKPSWEAGGIARVCYEVAKRLAVHHDVTTYTTDGCQRRLDVPTDRPVEDEGMTIHYFRNLSTRLASHNASLPYTLPFRARRDVENYDVIHVHTLRTALAVAVCHYARKHDVPYVIEAHGTLVPKYSKLRSKRLFDRLFGRRILAGAEKVIALNRTEAQHYESYGVEPDRIEIVPNGLDLSEYSVPPATDTGFRERHGIPLDHRVVLYVGRLHDSKGLDLLVEAFERVRATRPDTTLVIVGPDDGAEASLRRAVAGAGLDEAVVFAGYVPWEEKLAALATADVFVTPRFTGFPMTFLEAGAAGLPVVTTFVEEELDWLHEQVGLVTAYDEAAFADAVGRLLDDEPMRTAYGEAGRRLVDDRFTWDAVVARLDALYRDCLLDS
ncbi:glycosyl transferase family 1 [Salinigranum rubrum]|uniref:Glycosyl transferase family 1 n=1 Tax=Salinigranum rubrum TaxID=755307 RepID=A0A2I8VLT8_9EURY|nr:glycosyltransferase [Salinigranum rubrum]AUV82855.1 glycosyl transferase family 1 [Salinigranum rubrum]